MKKIATIITALILMSSLHVNADGKMKNKLPETQKVEKPYKLFGADVNNFEDAIIIQYNLKEDSDVRLILFNENGEDMIILDEGQRESDSYNFIIKKDELPEGNYCYILETDYGMSSNSFEI